MIKPAAIALVSTVLIMACSTTPVTDVNSPYYVPPPGSRFIVNREIKIDAHNTSAWFQGGDQKSFKDLNLYHPNCKFELSSPSEASRMIKPDVFIVTRVKQEEQTMNDDVPVRLAGASIGIGIGGGSRSGVSIGLGVGLGFGANGLSPIPYATVFYLKSEQQPDVLRLTCMHWEDPSDARYLTLSEIRQALGSYIIIETPQSAPTPK